MVLENKYQITKYMFIIFQNNRHDYTSIIFNMLDCRKFDKQSIQQRDNMSILFEKFQNIARMVEIVISMDVYISRYCKIILHSRILFHLRHVLTLSFINCPCHGVE
jgi:hypothetical protein